MSAMNEEGRSPSGSVDGLQAEAEEEVVASSSVPEDSSSVCSVEKGVPNVDDDQDRRNPQYIPKRGVFYEHDDRIDSDEDDSSEDKKSEGPEEETAPAAPPPRRLPKSEVASRWGHDKFAEGDQAPKTKDELVSVYGYDIRNEDTAPRARRRRKYGRGPNKYTRKWENEDAYVKSPGGGRGSHNKPRGGGGILIKKAPGKRPDESTNNLPSTRNNNDISSSNQETSTHPPTTTAAKKEKLLPPNNTTTPKPAPPKDIHNRKEAPPKDTHNRKEAPPRAPHNSSAGKNGGDHRMEHIDKTLGRTHISSTPSGGQRRSLDEPKPPKRYSSQRQRNPPRKEDSLGVGEQPHYYATAKQQPHYGKSFPVGKGYSGGFANASSSPGSSSSGGPPPAYLNPSGLVNYPPPVQYTVPVTVPVTVPLTMSLVGPHTESFSGVPLVPSSSNVVLPPPPPGGHLPELIAATAPTPNGGYAEVRGGVTYFNPTAQAPLLLRPVVSKRPKAAIPIIDPSNLSEKTNNSNSSQESTAEENNSNNNESNAVDIMNNGNNINNNNEISA